MAAQRPHPPDAQAHYRRGTVLGLTVAEVFILLLFLLMMAFLGLTQPSGEAERRFAEQAHDLQETRRELAAVRSRYEAWDPAVREFETPDEILTLRRDKATADREAHEARTAAEEALAQAEKASAEAANAQAETERARVEAEEARGAHDAARRELHTLQEKGQNPPCWYERIPDGRGGKREKPHYTFHIAVFERHMVVRRASTPPGGAADDGGGTYHSEALALGLQRIPYDTPLSDIEVQQHLFPVHRAGKDRHVRSYSCIFWARVWDMTPDHAKPRWKRAHDAILEGMFGAYTVVDLPWPPTAE